MNRLDLIPKGSYEIKNRRVYIIKSPVNSERNLNDFKSKLTPNVFIKNKPVNIVGLEVSALGTKIKKGEVIGIMVDL